MCSTSSPKHLVKVQGLTPGQPYVYQVGDGITWCASLKRDHVCKVGMRAKSACLLCGLTLTSTGPRVMSLSTPTPPCHRSSEISFTSLPAVGNVGLLRIGVFGDLGDTSNSSATLGHLLANQPAMVLNTGDMVWTFPRNAVGPLLRTSMRRHKLHILSN